jgi:hypothetical protein
MPRKQKLKARRISASVLLYQAQQLCLHILFMSLPWSGMSNEIKWQLILGFASPCIIIHSNKSTNQMQQLLKFIT